MKVLLIAVGVLFLGFTAFQLFAMNSTKSTETYPYTVLQEYETFEVRAYEASLFSAVNLPSANYEDISGKGFRVLAGYIFGGNDRQEKIAMTSPVAMTLGDTSTMMFMVPGKYAKSDLPAPNDTSISFLEMPAKKMAAIRFGGWANEKRIQQYKEELENALSAEGLNHNGNFFFYGYNPPYEVVNRRNEVLVELAE